MWRAPKQPKAPLVRLYCIFLAFLIPLAAQLGSSLQTKMATVRSKRGIFTCHTQPLDRNQSKSYVTPIQEKKKMGNSQNISWPLNKHVAIAVVTGVERLVRIPYACFNNCSIKSPKVNFYALRLNFQDLI